VSFPSVVRAIIAGERVLPKLLEVFMPRIRRPYPSDLSDEEWALLEPLLASSERRGRPPKWPARRVADAMFYLLRSGCAWRMRPRQNRQSKRTRPIATAHHTTQSSRTTWAAASAAQNSGG
jgi:transposase